MAWCGLLRSAVARLLMRGDETTAIFPPDQLMNVWLFVVGPIEGARS